MAKSCAKYSKLNSNELMLEVLKSRKKQDGEIPAFVSKDFDVDKLIRDKRTCYRLVPKEGFSGTYLFYLYGSMLSFNISDEQWAFITNLARATNCGIYVPIYPITPEHSCRETFKMIISEYEDFRKSVDVKKTILIGDGSGAGLAVSLCLLVWDIGIRKPDQLILVSPVLDTEFFDKKLEGELLEKSASEEQIFFNPAIKEFINKFWVRNMAANTMYTSPFYEELYDLCDDVVLFSSRDELFSSYNIAFYNKAKAQGVNIRFFEFENEKYDFMLYSKTEEAQKAFGYLIDVVNNTYYTARRKLYLVKRMADWSKYYSDIIKSDAAAKFMYEQKVYFEGMKNDTNEYRNMLMAASFAYCDDKVRDFIKMYPNATIVQIGCLMDDMFARVDNGRIRWYSIGSHNTMSVRRAMYGEKRREFTIGRNVLDFSWMDGIKCDRKKGIMFVCNDTLANMTKQQVKEMFERLKEKFPGAKIVFTVTTPGPKFICNLFKHPMVNLKKRRFATKDVRRLIEKWSSDYEVMFEDALMNEVKRRKKLRMSTKLLKLFNKITGNHKIVEVKLGKEVYELV